MDWRRRLRPPIPLYGPKSDLPFTPTLTRSGRPLPRLHEARLLRSEHAAPEIVNLDDDAVLVLDFCEARRTEVLRHFVRAYINGRCVPGPTCVPYRLADLLSENFGCIELNGA